MSAEQLRPTEPSAGLNPLDPASANELREARLEVVRLQVMIAHFAAVSAEDSARLAAGKSREVVLQQQIRDLRGSLSWKLTRPVRMAKRLVALNSRARGEE
jgi:hypothetical protein